MADSKSLYRVALKEIADSFEGTSVPYSYVNKASDIYCASMIAAAITNSRDAICLELKALTAAIKESGQ